MEECNEHCSRISHSPILEGINTPWSDLLELAAPICMPAGSPLQLGKRMDTDFYYLASGMIRLTHLTNDGLERAILYLKRGNLFNEAAAIAGYYAPACAFHCVENCEIYRFPGSLLHDPVFYGNYPLVIMNLAQNLARKFIILLVSLSNSARLSATAKISRFIVSLYLRHGEKNEFEAGITQDELARLLGLHRASIVRALAELKKSGAVLEFTKHKVRIGNGKLLEEFAANNYF